MHLIATKIITILLNNANGVINATNNPNMDANAINGGWQIKSIQQKQR